jgi:hypothetical protein
VVLTAKEIVSAVVISAGFMLFILFLDRNPDAAFRLGSAFLLVSLVATSERNARSGPYGLGRSGLT